jgi:hypothetical protein
LRNSTSDCARDERGARRQRRQCVRHRRLHHLQGSRHIAVPVEVDRQLGTAASGSRAHVDDTAHRTNGLFEGLRDVDEHLIGGPVAGVDIYRHAREVRLREQSDR